MKIEPMILKRYEILEISNKTIDFIDGLYQGQCAFDKPHGKGSMTYYDLSDNSKFDGLWIAGK